MQEIGIVYFDPFEYFFLSVSTYVVTLVFYFNI